MVTCTLCAFISLVWLREQIVHGGAPQWLEQNQQQPLNGVGQQNEVKLNCSVIHDKFRKCFFFLINTLLEPNGNVVLLQDIFICTLAEVECVCLYKLSDITVTFLKFCKMEC